ncbi:hypothetical protein C2869_00545 [Saccharobesus litoralis]|uniref:histidine kinase n=1 Tax=Saccharobesus litoralis TaxID=2172099 RepID=A0A2S0VLM9_9ALTE|nr:ATP-binding protein [Saccharobesus litoralis]AWB65020.1 hypothetical protein C2869_00545 [Saccharobesus litoralis]
MTKTTFTFDEARHSMQMICINALHVDAMAEQEDKQSQYIEAIQLLEQLFKTKPLLMASLYIEPANEELHIQWYGESTCVGDHSAIFNLEDYADDEWVLDLLSCHLHYSRNSAQSLNQRFRLHLPEGEFTVQALECQEQCVGLLVYQSVPEDELHIQYYDALFNTLRLLFFNKQQKNLVENKLQTYKQVMNLMPQRVFWKNKKSVYQGANMAFARDASMSDPEHLIGVTDHDIFPSEAELYRSDDARTMQTRIHMINSDEPQTHANGKTIWLRTSKRPIINQDEQVIGVVGTYDDITELKVVQQELQEAKDNLELRVKERTQELSDSNERLEKVLVDLSQAQAHLVDKEKMAALGGLVAGISHEINTPVGIAVTGSSHLNHVVNQLQTEQQSGKLTRAKFENLCSELNEGCDIILQNLNRASQLIANFKMIAVDQSHDEKRSLLVREYVEQILSTLQPKLRARDITISINIDTSLSAEIYPGAFAQIITNLTENALLHAFENQDGQINIQIESADQQMQFIFSDTGTGIDDSALKQIFDPFFTTKRSSGGSGLGLNIVYNLVTQRLGGKIECESYKGKGTEFKMQFPI